MEIIRFYNEWKRKPEAFSGERKFVIRNEFEVYSRKNQAGALAEVFEGMLGKNNR